MGTRPDPSGNGAVVINRHWANWELRWEGRGPGSRTGRRGGLLSLRPAASFVATVFVLRAAGAAVWPGPCPQNPDTVSMATSPGEKSRVAPSPGVVEGVCVCARRCRSSFPSALPGPRSELPDGLAGRAVGWPSRRGARAGARGLFPEFWKRRA